MSKLARAIHSATVAGTEYGLTAEASRATRTVSTPVLGKRGAALQSQIDETLRRGVSDELLKRLQAKTTR